MPLTDFVNHPKTLLIAPAGHGKTHAIAECVKMCPEGSRQLVLTHTHAGISSIKSKLKKLEVEESKYEVTTITGFAQRIVRAFAGLKSLGFNQDDKGYFDEVVKKCTDLLSIDSVASVVKLSYNGLFVDEYQDCNRLQHAMVMKMVDILPTHVLGDPLQGIYSFAGGSIDFAVDLNEFERFNELTIPWRWRSDGNTPELGNKIIDIRRILESDNKRIQLIDDEQAHFRFCRIDQATDINYYTKVGNFLRKIDDSSVLILIPSYTDGFGRLRGGIDERAQLCRQLSIDHDYILLEAIDDKTFYTVAKAIDQCISVFSKHRKGTKHVKTIASILESLKFNKTAIAEWIDSTNNRLKVRRAPNKENSEILASLVGGIAETPSVEKLLKVICFFEKTLGFRSKRPSVLFAIKKCILNSIENGLTVYQNMCNYKNALRVKGRKVEGRYVGTTLLTKGLEFSTVVILDAHHFEDSMNFYVAISRASKDLCVLSANNNLSFNR